MTPHFKKIIPLIKWGFSGGLAVTVDLSLLFILVEIAHVHYLLAAATAFLISATVNYTISGLAIFRNAQHSIRRSYATFMSISLIGLGAIAVCMFVFVDILNIHYMIARIFLALTLGFSSFFLHKYLSFKDVGKIPPPQS